MGIHCLCGLGVVKGWRKMQKDFLVPLVNGRWFNPKSWGLEVPPSTGPWWWRGRQGSANRLKVPSPTHSPPLRVSVCKDALYRCAGPLPPLLSGPSQGLRSRGRPRTASGKIALIQSFISKHELGACCIQGPVLGWAGETILFNHSLAISQTT